MKRIAVTLGDLGGIGPEIWQKLQTQYSGTSELVLIDDLLSSRPAVNVGTASKEAGEHAYRVLVQAHQMLMNKEFYALVTGPVSKQSLAMASYNYSGQTELLADLAGLSSNDVEMLFLWKEFRLLLVTRHIPLKDVPKQVEKRLAVSLRAGIKYLQSIGILKPRIKLLALNPHAGEDGLLGREEQDFIKPTLLELASEADFEGPLAADASLARIIQQINNKQELDFDLLVSLYHDQALPVLKGLAAYEAVNYTWGLPYPRLSPDHGTAFDIAGLGLADPSGLIAAVELASLS